MAAHTICFYFNKKESGLEHIYNFNKPRFDKIFKAMLKEALKREYEGGNENGK